MIRVMVVDDEWMVRSMLRTILEAAGDMSVVAEAPDGISAVEEAERHQPDVALVDIRMPESDGLAATARLQSLPRPPRVIVLTTFDLDEYVQTALRNGAVGFLLKDSAGDDMITAIRAVAAGDAMLAPSITRRLLHTFTEREPSRQAKALEQLDVLTDKEREVLVALAEGLANADVASRLYLSEATVKTHVSRILSKLKLTNRVQAAILAHRAGLAG